VTPDAHPAFLVLDHEHVEGDLWASLWLALLILLSLAILQTFWLDRPRQPLFSYDDLLALGRLSFELVELGPSSHRAKPCSCSPGMGPC
jgi:hypothetical protein